MRTGAWLILLFRSKSPFRRLSLREWLLRLPNWNSVGYRWAGGSSSLKVFLNTSLWFVDFCPLSFEMFKFGPTGFDMSKEIPEVFKGLVWEDRLGGLFVLWVSGLESNASILLWEGEESLFLFLSSNCLKKQLIR